MMQRRPSARWLGVAVALVVLATAAVVSGLALQAAAPGVVVAQADDERDEGLRRLQADRAARDLRAAVAAKAAARKRSVSGAADGAARTPAQPRRERALRLGSGYSSRAGSERVRRLQRALRRLGLVPRRVTSQSTGRPVLLSRTGQFGPVTERGVRRFQQRAGLPVTGVADARTLRRVYAAARRQGPTG